MSEIIIGSVSVLVVAIFSFFQYKSKDKKDKEKREFETYHDLIIELVVPQYKYKDQMPKVAERLAVIVYELRNYEKYAEISVKVLEQLKSKEQENFLLDEINNTIKFLNNNRSSNAKIN